MPRISQFPLETAPNADSDIVIEHNGQNYRFKYGKLFPVTAIGDIIYADSLTSYVALPIGTEGQRLAVSSGLPAWEDASQQFCLVSKSAVQTIGTGSETIVTWNTDLSDDNNWHDTVTNNHIILPPAGFYQASFFYDSAGAGGSGNSRWTARLYNGSSVAFSDRVQVEITAHSRFRCITTPIIELNGTDGIAWTLQQTDGGNRDIAITSRFSVVRVR